MLRKNVMFGRHRIRRSSNIFFVIFRLMLSLIMFAVLLAGVYSAYKHFSGLDPLNLNPQTLISSLIKTKTLQQVLPSGRQILGQNQASSQPAASSYLFRFMMFADSHSDNVSLQKALNQARANYPDLKFAIGLGDYSEVGTVQELQDTKSVLDSYGLRYFLAVGDHDLWDSRDKQKQPLANFTSVFGPDFQSFTQDNLKLIVLNNADNYTGLGDEQIKWLTSELEKAGNEKTAVIIFLHEPLYHPSSDHVMGRVGKNLKLEAKGLILQLKEAGVKKVFAADTHYFSEYEEPESKLPMVTVGAVTGDRNPQAPRFAIGYVFEDGNIKVEDVEIR